MAERHWFRFGNHAGPGGAQLVSKESLRLITFDKAGRVSFGRWDYLIQALSALALCLPATGNAAEGPLPAFPGADGFGAFTKGGRGGKVVRVTNLNRRGPGSFSWALNEVKAPRTIVFTVGGVIDCRDEIAFIVNACSGRGLQSS